MGKKSEIKDAILLKLHSPPDLNTALACFCSHPIHSLCLEHMMWPYTSTFSLSSISLGFQMVFFFFFSQPAAA